MEIRKGRHMLIMALYGIVYNGGISANILPSLFTHISIKQKSFILAFDWLFIFIHYEYGGGDE
jgi:hypothetical protein